MEAGLLEIYRFLPPPLLEGFDPEKAEIGEFLGCIAKARYVQELESSPARSPRYSAVNDREARQTRESK